MAYTENQYNFGRAVITIESDTQETLQLVAGTVLLTIKETTADISRMGNSWDIEYPIGYEVQVNFFDGVEIIFGDIKEDNKKKIDKIFRKIIILSKNAKTD